MSGYKKIIFFSFVVWLVMSTVFFYKPAHVFGQFIGPMPTVVVADVPATKFTIWQKITAALDKVKAGLTTQLVNRTLSTFMNKLAYDMANNIATGGPGRTPLFEQQSFTKSIQTAKDAALGEFIGQLSQNSFEDLGFNLCDPSLSVKLSLTLSLVDSRAPARPTCDWRKVQNEWAKFGDNFTADLIKLQLDTRGGSKNLDDFFASGFSMEQTDLGVFAKLSEAARQKELDAAAAKKALNETCAGYLEVQGPIAEDVKASCRDVEAFKDMVIFKAADIEQTQIGDSSLKKEIGAIGQIMKTAGNIFVNTFTSKLMNRWIKDGMWSVFGGSKATNPNLRDSLLAQLRGGSDVSKSNSGFFMDFQKIEPDILESYNIFEEYAVCPEDVEFRTPDNCVVSSNFLQAVSSKTTVQDAIDKGLLNGNAPFIGIDDSLRNASRECYKDAFCYSNLVKLRKTNVIPVGWELAALASPVDKPVSLQQAIDCFEDATGKCQLAIDPATGHNPLYHLVDPYWILKTPAALCNAYVYSPILESPDTSNRQQYCADVKTCLREDANGNCLSGEYGYCTKTENIWRFTGDECKDGDIYSGCLTFQNETLPTASYLEQSLDYCAGDQVGCKRYSQEQNNDGNWVLQDIATDADDLFLNNKSATCPSDMAGCSEYIVMGADTGANLVPNGSFNNIDGDKSLAFATGTPDGWVVDIGGGRTQDSDGLNYDGNRLANGYPWGSGGAGRVNGTESIYQLLPLLPNTTYRVSASAGRYMGAASLGRVSIVLCDDNTCGNTSTAYPVVGGGDCVVSAGDNNPDLYIGKDNPDTVAVEALPTDGSMMRNTCTFTTNNTPIREARLHVVADSGQVTWFDDIKVEIVSTQDKGSSNFSDYGVGSKINMNGSRFMCTANEVGCQGYTPSNGDPMIPAVISQNDLCPNECVGYATFAEAPDGFDIIENTNPLGPSYNSYNFIPSKARSCPATAVGCEEFTNVDAVADGGEGKEYYTYLRQCVAVNLGEDYITWEGTDVAGYQIRAWKALPSDSSATVTAPCTNIRPGSDICSDTPATIAACGPETDNPLDDSSVNANCRQFFDASGNSFWRLQDRIIFATDDCHDYRRTANSTIYRATPAQSTRCSADQNGCRAYYGNAANNVRNIFTDDFERATYAPWAPVTSEMSLSSESLERNGHSLKITSQTLPAAAGYVAIGAIQNKKQYQLSWWMKSSASMSEVYWDITIPNNGVGSELVTRISSASDVSLINIPANNWQHYTVTYNLNLLDSQLPLYNLNDATLRFVGRENAADETVSVFIDNVILKEVASNIYAIRNSWSTPVSCDSPYTGYHLGCQTYTDTNRNSYNLKSFTSMCRVEAIGCMAVIDTHNSDNPFTETFNAGDFSSLTVPADNIDYLVPDNRKYCSSSYQGCQALGLPDRSNPSYLPTVYKINDPDQYNASLCLNEAMGCEEYSSSKGAYYFKDPGIDTCTYQSNIMVAGNIVSGWFKTANLKDPLPLGCLDTNNAYDATDFELEQKAATCPADKNLCTTFYDASDPAGCDSVGTCRVSGADVPINNERECRSLGGIYKAPDCQAYYYYNNSKIDKASCNGQVNKNNGCVLFKDANSWNADHTVLNVNYDSAQSYDLNLSRASAVSPVTCDPVANPATCTLDSNVLLKVAKDRQCSEWLACRSSSVVWDKDNNRYKVVCSDMGTCIKYDSTNNVTKCAEWLPVDADTSALTVASYQDRATGVDDRVQFGDDDYTGYSIPNMLPMPTLTVVNLGSDTAPDPQLVYDTGSSCTGTTCNVTLGDDQFTGVCKANRCLVNPVVNGKNTFKVETRGYAQVDSPFPSSISPDQGRLDRLQAYAGANMCEVDQVDPIKATPNGCETTYVKVTYGTGGEVRYYPNNLPSPNGICSSGDTDASIDCVDSAGVAHNNLCDTYNTNGTSRSDGSCSKKTRAETISNWPGICLEYDSSAKVVNDTNGTNYCNQWYPADQIAGASSLFDNYREAGYYEPAGRDALFCAVTAPFETYNERVYCIANSTSMPNECNALAVVPLGSKINAASLNSDSSVVSYGFLKEDAYTFVPAEGIVEDYPTNNEFVSGIGLDRIEKKYLGGEVTFSDARFRDTDFILSPNTKNNQVPVTSLNVLSKIFDVPNGDEIAVYYLDEDVGYNFKEDSFNRIWIGDRLQNFNAAPASDPYIPTGTWGCYEPATSGTTSPDDDYNSCDDCQADFGKTWHSVLNGTTEASGTTHGFCNPLPYNYYVRASLKSNCSKDCSDSVAGIPKGQACLQAQSVYASIDISGTCASTNYACKFKKCVEQVHGTVPTHWCPDYGSIRYGFRSDGGIDDVQAIEGCVAHLFNKTRVDSSVFSIDGLTLKNTITEALAELAVGNLTRVGNFYVETDSEGCLESSVDAVASCADEKGLSDVKACWNAGYRNTSSIDLPLGITIPENLGVYCSPYRYSYTNAGATCVGSACYQQCQIVTQLDPEGDKSWVRTDIWWRNENGTRNNYPSTNTWLSYYYKAGFIQNDKVSYSGITGENVKFTHFGSALGFLGNDVVNVRVPVNATIFSPLSAVTFYAAEADGISAAHQQLAYLFYRAYNLKWDTGTTSYLPNGNASYAGDNIYTGTITSTGQNTQAGPDFNPVILQVCGSDLCRVAGVATPGITINDVQSDNVSGKKSIFAAFKFYYYAHPDHMPIKNIIIDWGDSSNDTLAPGKYKNNIPECNPDIAMPGKPADTRQGFGGTDRACREAYKTFYHDYQYDINYPCDGVRAPSYTDITGAVASCYKPTVTVQDHWYTSGDSFKSTETYDDWVVVYKE